MIPTGVDPAMNSHLLHDLARDPVVVAWEVTRACGYRCTHCRANAQPRPAAGELDHREGLSLVRALSGFAGTTLILTGGDPLLRDDLLGIAEHAAASGLRVALTPSATPRVTPRRLVDLARAGVAQIALSIDGADATAHDGMRGIRGSFARTLRILANARDAGMRTQVNTTVTRSSAPDLEGLARIVAESGAEMWSVFFLVPVGRGSADDMLDAMGHEDAFHRLADMTDAVPFRLKVTEAPAYRRVLIERGHHGPSAPPVNGARGFMFVSHDGNVCPSGFLPLVAGNVRTSSPISLYRESPLFRGLRDPTRLRGRCGACEYRSLCGGSRARAWATTGDMFAEDPTCIHEPGSETPC